MKSLVLLGSLAWLAAASPLVADRRDATPAKAGVKVPISRTKLEPLIDKNAIRERLIWGPYMLQPPSATHKTSSDGIKLDPNSDAFSDLLDGICRNCVVLNASLDASDEKGRRYEVGDGVYNHHFIVMDVGKQATLFDIKANCSGKFVPAGASSSMMMDMGAAKPAAGGAGVAMAGHSHKRAEPAPPAAATPAKQSGGFMSSLFSNLSKLAVASWLLKPSSTEAPAKAPAAAVVPAAPAAAAPPAAAAGADAAPGGEMAGIGGMFAGKKAIFIGKGNERTARLFADLTKSIKAGYLIGADDVINMTMELVNYNDKETAAYVTLDYEYLPTIPEGYLDAAMGGLPIDGCGGLGFHPPEDKALEIPSSDYHVFNDGYILNTNAHMHDGAIWLKFYVNGEEKCNTEAIYGGEKASDFGGANWETITDYKSCEKPVPVKKGDVLTMKALYDVTKHKLRPSSDGHGEAEGMAILNFFFVADNKAKAIAA